MLRQEQKECRRICNNFIMSYQQFNQRQPYSNVSGFMSWSQSVAALFPPPPHNLLRPQSLTSLFPFSPYPFLFGQQSNFFNSNFIVNSHLPESGNGLILKHKQSQQGCKRSTTPKPSINPNEVIVISDDEQSPTQLKLAVTVAKNKHQPQLFRPKEPLLSLQNHKTEKQFTQAKKSQGKESKIVKRAVKTEESGKEEDVAAKKKKIYKERSGSKFSLYFQELEVSKYRNYRPDMIMVGPRFQANIDDAAIYRERKEWMRQVRQGLEMRRQQ